MTIIILLIVDSAVYMVKKASAEMQTFIEDEALVAETDINTDLEPVISNVENTEDSSGENIDDVSENEGSSVIIEISDEEYFDYIEKDVDLEQTINNYLPLVEKFLLSHGLESSYDEIGYKFIYADMNDVPELVVGKVDEYIALFYIDENGEGQYIDAFSDETGFYCIEKEGKILIYQKNETAYTLNEYVYNAGMINIVDESSGEISQDEEDDTQQEDIDSYKEENYSNSIALYELDITHDALFAPLSELFEMYNFTIEAE